MCFDIAKEQTRWTTKRVYKVMYFGENRKLKSPHFPKGLFYRVGETIHCHADYYFDIRYSSRQWTAKAGIYVLHNIESALMYGTTLVGPPIIREITRAIVECEVDPNDFLYHDTESTMATYKKAKFSKIIKMMDHNHVL
jgi:hypothetical protein